MSFTLGFPILTAGTVRYWIYAPKGLSPGRVASLTVIAGLTFWLGMGIVLAWSLIREAGPLRSSFIAISRSTSSPASSPRSWWSAISPGCR